MVAVETERTKWILDVLGTSEQTEIAVMVAVETERNGFSMYLGHQNRQNLLTDKSGAMRPRPRHTIPRGTTYMKWCNVVPLETVREREKSERNVF